MNLAAPPHRTQTDNSEDEPYRVVSVESAETPAGCAGRDWFVYRIMQGTNGITGYRRGNRESVRGDAETIVVALTSGASGAGAGHGGSGGRGASHLKGSFGWQPMEGPVADDGVVARLTLRYQVAFAEYQDVVVKNTEVNLTSGKLSRQAQREEELAADELDSARYALLNAAALAHPTIH